LALCVLAAVLMPCRLWHLHFLLDYDIYIFLGGSTSALQIMTFIFLVAMPMSCGLWHLRCLWQYMYLCPVDNDIYVFGGSIYALRISRIGGSTSVLRTMTSTFFVAVYLPCGLWHLSFWWQYLCPADFKVWWQYLCPADYKIYNFLEAVSLSYGLWHLQFLVAVPLSFTNLEALSVSCRLWLLRF
jgi:hypothetical protein